MDPKKIAYNVSLYRLSAIGINLGACLFVGLGLGLLAKKYLHLGNWVVVFGIVIGILAGFTESYREIRLLTADQMKKTPPDADRR